jgi:phosphatidylethanolamine-binding protein (PEBP) family uncharacterized protein
MSHVSDRTGAGILAAAASIALALGLTACGVTSPVAAPSGAPSGPPVLAEGSTFTVTSESVAPDGELADSVLSSVGWWCPGSGQSPHVSWTAGPEGTVAFALKMENLTGPFIYWLQYDIPTDQLGVAEGGQGALRGTKGRNSVSPGGFVGPCPNRNETSEYLITVYALDVSLGEAGLRVEDFDARISGHVLAQDSVHAWKLITVDA